MATFSSSSFQVIVNSHLLTIDDLDSVFSCVKDLQGHWKRIGECFGIKPFKKDSIEVEGSQGCEDQLKKVLKCWLKGEGIQHESPDHDAAVSPSNMPLPPTLQSQQPSWKSLAEAVKILDEKKAIEIARDHQCDCPKCIEAAGIRNTPVGHQVRMGHIVDAAYLLYEDFDAGITHILASKQIPPDALKESVISRLKPDNGSVHVMDHLAKMGSFKLSRKMINYLNTNNLLSYINYGLLKRIWSVNCPLPKFAEYEKDHSCLLQSSLKSFSCIFDNPDLELHPPKGLPTLTIHLNSKWSDKSLLALQKVLERRTKINPDYLNIVSVSISSQNCLDVIYAVWPCTVLTVINEFTAKSSALNDDGVSFEFSEELAALLNQQTVTKQLSPALDEEHDYNEQKQENSGVAVTVPSRTRLAKIRWNPPSLPSNDQCVQYKLSYKAAGNQKWREHIVNVNHACTLPYTITMNLSEETCCLSFKWEECMLEENSLHEHEIPMSNTNDRPIYDDYKGTLSLELNDHEPAATMSPRYLVEICESSNVSDTQSHSIDSGTIPEEWFKLKPKLVYDIVFVEYNRQQLISSSGMFQPLCKLKVQAKKSNEIYVEWENKPSKSPKNIKSYIILCYETSSSKCVSSQYSQGSRNYTFKCLPQGTYYFGVKAVFSDGTESHEIRSKSIQTLVPVSDSPCLLKAEEIYHNHVLLHWEVPKHITNEPESPQKYSIQYQSTSSFNNEWNCIPPDRINDKSCLVENLDENTTYHFQLHAHYAGGRCICLAKLFIKTSKLQLENPGKPEFKEFPESDEVEIKWQRPVCGDERVHVQEYELFSHGMQGTTLIMRRCNKNVVKIPCHQFTPDEKYIFKVRAIYSDGNLSEFSKDSKKFVKQQPQVLGKPKVIRCTSNSIQLKWNKTQHFHASRYKVKYAENNKKNWQYIEISSEMATIENLKPDTLYVFKVKAKSESHSGYGSASELSDPIKTTLPPPTKLQIISHGTSSKPLKLTWRAPEYSSSTPVLSGYEIYCLSKQKNEWCLYRKFSNTHTEAEITELDIGTYQFKVCAHYSKGVHQQSESSASELSEWYTISYPIPSPPENPMITNVDQDSVLLKWSKPAVNGEHVKSYNVYVGACTNDKQRGNFELYKSKITQEQLQVTELLPSTTYKFQIEAFNSDDRGGKVESDFVTTTRKAPTRPGKPYMLRVTHNMVRITWEKPMKNSDMVSQYEVYYKKCQQAEDVEWMSERTQSNNTEIEIYNLDHSTQYSFKVGLIIENINYCTYSEVSEPVTTKSALPSEPGKPKGETDSDGSITLAWARPEENFKEIFQYEVEYHQEGDKSNTIVTKTDSAEEQIRITGLCHNKGYYFSVKAVTKTGESSKPSLLSDLITSEKTLAAKFLPFCDIIGNVGNSTLHLLPTVPVYSSTCNSLRKLEIKLKNHGDFINPLSAVNQRPMNKVLMLVGATGAGKSTLINAMINYIMRVEYGNPFRLKLIHEPDVSQTESVTKFVSAYVVHYESGFAIPYTLTIVDTPGFGDTAGIERDKEITLQIKNFFSIKQGITHLDGVGFVCQSSVMRLTPTQRYVFESMLSIFGNDVKDNIFVMCTFGDGIEEPQVIKAVKEVNIPADKYYEFNNSALYSSKASNKAEQSWEMGVESFRMFFQQLNTVKSVSLQLTKDVLQQREDLDAMATELKQQIQETMVMIDQVKKDIEDLNKLQKQKKDNDASGEFCEVLFEEEVVEKVKLKKGERANNCLKCNMTCHYPCMYSLNPNGCIVMEKKKSKTYCTKCPRCCSSSDHKIVSSHRLEKHKTSMKKSFKEIAEKYANKEKMYNMDTIQNAIESLKNEIDSKFDEVFKLVREAKDCNEKLDAIALLPCHFNDVQYIELLIGVQKQEMQEGYTKRIEQYEVLKERAEIFTQTGEFIARRDKDGKRWWEKRFLKSE